ncbi:MAG TPA: ABC transporter ATP-binding protein [Candidatus Limnocylindrales bacterium]
MLTLDHVSKIYKVGTFGGTDLAAVKDVSFNVDAGQVVSLIGESGSGKTTIGRMILRLTQATRGTITFDGQDVAKLPRRGYYRLVQGVFQDPFSSYNPIFKADHVFGMIRSVYFRGMPNAEWDARVEAALEAVGLDPDQVLHKYPHQLSGGQLQRLLIARALLLDIRMLVADEIISMLDASTRIDVLNLLGDLKARGLGILFITHDLSLGYYSSQRTLILLRGQIVEMGATEKVYGNPTHPYTKMLIGSVPLLHKKWRQVEQELETSAVPVADECTYHALHPEFRGDGARAAARPALVEVEEDHFVGCIRPYLKGTC